VEIDVLQIQANINALDKIVKTGAHKMPTPFREWNEYYAQNQRAVAALNTSLQATWNVGNPIDGSSRDTEDTRDKREAANEDTRDKRAALAVASAAFGMVTGAYKVYQLRQFRKQMQQQDNQLDDLALQVKDIDTTLSRHGARLTALEDWSVRIQQNLLDHAQDMRTQHFVEGHIAEVTRQVEEVSQIMDGLLAGRLSPKAIRPDAMGTLLHEMETGATISGHTLLVKNPGEAFQSKCSFIATARGYFIFLHVPMAKTGEIMDLWHLVGTPIAVSAHRHMTVHTPFDVLAISNDKESFRSMTMSELTVCDKRADYHFCPAGNIHSKAAILKTYGGGIDDQLCTLFVFEAKYAEVKTACRFQLAKPSNQGFLLSGNRAVFVGATPQQGTIKCEGKVTTNFEVEGITEVEVGDGCVAETPYFAVTGTTIADSSSVERTYRWPAGLAPLWDGLDLTLLKEVEDAGIKDIPTEVNELRLFLEGTRRSHSAWIQRLGLGIAILVVAAAGIWATVWTWRNKVLLQRKMRALLIHGTDKLLDAVAAGEYARQEHVDQVRTLLLPRDQRLARDQVDQTEL
jgi:hypothetical protein